MGKRKPLSTAATRLRAALAPPPSMNQTMLAEKLGVTPQCVSSWLQGRSRPDLETMLAIEKLFGITPAEWAKAAANARKKPEFRKAG